MLEGILKQIVRKCLLDALFVKTFMYIIYIDMFVNSLTVAVQ